MRVLKWFNIFVHRGCNLKCSFCPERKKNLKMEEKRIDYIINLLRQLFKDNIYVENIKFFGGEPLLNFNFIRKFILRLKKEFGNLSKNVGILRITTNGWLLNDEIIEFFNNYKLRVNISLSGQKEIYELDRGLKISSSRWQFLINNLRKIENIFINFNFSPAVVDNDSLQQFQYIYNISHNINFLPIYFIDRNKYQLKRYFYGLNTIEKFLIGKEFYLENYENFSFMPLHNFGVNIDTDGKVYFTSLIVELPDTELQNFLLHSYKDFFNKNSLFTLEKKIKSYLLNRYSNKYLKINNYLDRGLDLFLWSLKK